MIGLIWLSGVSRGTTKTNCHWFLLQRHENSSNTAWITGKLMLTCVIIEIQIQIDYNTFATLIWVWNKYFAYSFTVSLSHWLVHSFTPLSCLRLFDFVLTLENRIEHKTAYKINKLWQKKTIFFCKVVCIQRLIVWDLIPNKHSKTRWVLRNGRWSPCFLLNDDKHRQMCLCD